MTGCPDCLAASTSHTWGGYHSNCDGCEIRAIAKSPLRVIEDWLDRIEKAHGEEARQAHRDRLAGEWKRIKALRRAAKENHG